MTPGGAQLRRARRDLLADQGGQVDAPRGPGRRQVGGLGEHAQVGHHAAEPDRLVVQAGERLGVGRHQAVAQLFEPGLQGAERGAQLVGDVRGHLPARGRAALHGVRGVVEAVRQVGDLTGAGRPRPRAALAPGERTRDRGELGERSGQPAGHQPAGHDRQEQGRHGRPHDPGPGELASARLGPGGPQTRLPGAAHQDGAHRLAGHPDRRAHALPVTAGGRQHDGSGGVGHLDDAKAAEATAWTGARSAPVQPSAPR